MKLVTTKFNSGGLHEKHVVATWNLGNHLSICLQAQENQEKPVSRWSAAGPSGYWLLAGSPASKVKTAIHTHSTTNTHKMTTIHTENYDNTHRKLQKYTQDNYNNTHKTISITYCESVSVALVIQHSVRMRRTINSGLFGCRMFFPHYLIDTTIFGKKVAGGNICVFWFSLLISSEIFLILRRTKRGVTINIHWSSREVTIILVKSLVNLNFLDKFSRNTQTSNSRKSLQREPSCLMRRDGQTWSW